MSSLIYLHVRGARARMTMTLSMRCGMDAFTELKDDTQDRPAHYRMLYRPRLYVGAKLGARFERVRGQRKTQLTASGRSVAHDGETREIGPRPF